MSTNFAASDLTLGQANALVKLLGGMEVAMDLLRGTIKATMEIIRHIIDLDTNPFCPDVWKVESHKKGGKLEWNQDKIQLYFSPNQEGDKCIKGTNLQKELENQPVLNANVLDYLLAHQELIPEEWKDKYIFFWGTIYRRVDDNLCVRYLCFDGEFWRWHYRWLGDGFVSKNPAAVVGQVS